MDESIAQQRARLLNIMQFNPVAGCIEDGIAPKHERLKVLGKSELFFCWKRKVMAAKDTEENSRERQFYFF